MERIRIFNLLSYLSTLEELSGQNNLLSNKYHIKLHQETYCNSECKQNYYKTSQIHSIDFKIQKKLNYLKYKHQLNDDDKKKRRNSINLIISKKIKLKYKNLNRLNNLNKRINKEREKIDAEWLNKLPFIIKHKIFINCTHQSLINLILNNPKYLNLLIKPIYWKYIKITFNSKILSLNKLNYLINYLNNNLKYLSINWYDYKVNNDYNKIEIDDLLLKIPNLTHLIIDIPRFSNDFNYDNKLINVIQNNLLKLSYLDIKYSRLTNDNLINLTNKLKYLHSIKLYSECIDDNGFIYFINNSNKLIYLDLSHLSITDK